MVGEQHERFHLKDLSQLAAAARRLCIDVPADADVSILSDSITIGGKVAPNRFAVQPMEGFDSSPDGSPCELSFRRYRRYAAGGFGLIWFEATAVMHEARSNPNQFYIHDGNVDAYAELVSATRKVSREEFGYEPVLIIQLTHSGRYSKPTGTPEPIIAHHSAVLDPKHALADDYPLVTDDYLDALQDTYVNAARIAAKAGFDGVGIKSCHRYLIAELHASFTREGKYGGSFENRTRLLRETVTRIKEEVPDVFVTTRMNAYDAISYPYGFGVDKDDYRIPDLAEPLELAGELRKIGVPILNVSIGNPYFNPHFGRPYDFPIAGDAAPDDHPLVGIARFLGITRQFQEKYPDLPIVGSGYSWLRHLMPNVAAAVIRTGGAAFLGIGRGAFAYPETPSEVLAGRGMDPGRCCVTCSACTQIMRDGGRTGCVVRDSEIYGPQYRLARRFAVDRLREEAARCRDCEAPTCSMKCPARVDVPAFIKAFADDDIAAAYDVLRENNALPEMCAYVCPSEVQCESGCLEDIFCKDPIPIRDIQLVVCQLARRKGLTGVRLPSHRTDRRIAVVGGGPAGIASAISLIEKGHSVTIFERSCSLGGTPDSIIPADRYDTAESEVSAIFAPAREAGVLDVRLGTELGADISLEALVSDYDAVMLAMGVLGSSSIGEANGVVDALAFLSDVKKGTITSVPDRVAVLGGGNTAMDAAVIARELGATDVFLIYRRSFGEMPAWPRERDKFMASGGHCLVLTQPVSYEADGSNNLTGLRIARTELGDTDESGRRRPAVVPDTESVLKVDLVVEALGQRIPDDLRGALSGISLTSRGFVETGGRSTLAGTSMVGVFAAGDIVNGGTTAVQGVAEGMRAAEEIDHFLGEK